MAIKATVYVSFVQPKKRSNTKTRHWYVDPNILLLRRVAGKTTDSYIFVCCVISGIQRQNHTDEVMLEPGYEYLLLPFSCSSSRIVDGAPFRVTTYSSSPVSIKQEVNRRVFGTEVRKDALSSLHRQLLTQDIKLHYPVSERCLLVCVQFRGCLYFVGVNGSPDAYLCLRIIVDLPDGIVAIYGDDEVDLPPSTQKICRVVSTNGRFSTATELQFRYLASLKVVSNTKPIRFSKDSSRRLNSFGDPVVLGVAADLLVSAIDPTLASLRGGGQVDTAMWIPQSGAS